MDIRAAWRRMTRFTVTLFGNIIDDQVFFRGTSLAFTSFIALVPVTMVIFSFGGFNQLSLRIMDALSKFLLPESSDEIVAIFNTFTMNARNLSTWGSVLFLFAAVMLLNAMETHLNHIFRARSRRSPAGRAGLYIASLVLVAFIFGSGFGPISGIMDAWNKVPAPGQRVLGIVLSILGAMAGMMAQFGLLSSARIRFPSALLGSFIGAVSFQAAKFVFAFWMQRSVRQSVIYGSLVFLPKLLLWLAVAWIIFLISAEITYALQMRAGRRIPYRPGSPADETELGWKAFLALTDDFRLGRRPPGRRDLAHLLEVDENRVDQILRRMEEGELVRQVSGHPPGYVPAMAPADLDADRVMAVITGWDRIKDCEQPEEAPRLLREGIASKFGNRSVRSFLADEESPSDP